MKFLEGVENVDKNDLNAILCSSVAAPNESDGWFCAGWLIVALT